MESTTRNGCRLDDGEYSEVDEVDYAQNNGMEKVMEASAKPVAGYGGERPRLRDVERR